MSGKKGTDTLKETNKYGLWKIIIIVCPDRHYFYYLLDT